MCTVAGIDMNVQEWKEYYRYMRVKPEKRSLMVERCGGLQGKETVEEAYTRICGEIKSMPDEEEKKVRKVIDKVLAERGIFDAV